METTRERSAYDAAANAMRKGLTKDHGGAKAEIRFGEAYQVMVRAGQAQQIRKRYRPGA